ncbi:MAG TPA: GMC family oxidoreductase N-terminal domain-containing protein, partial [Cyclobacteriaceae bacterium]|nr:GMC family oxidoreductase N-terminal domain-containing protein [Cyclobacteriaceae bacterium]
MKSEYDAIIVGSGFGAAPPALRLVRAGLSTLVIEKGPFIDPLKDFRHSQDPNYLLKYLKSIHSNNLTLNYAEALGGGSGFFEKIALRAPDIIFNQVSASGGSLWPGGIDRKMLDRWYAIGEGMLKIHQISLKNVPKTGLVFAMLMKNLNYSVERCRYADSFCSGCGYCAFGCVHGGKESLLVNYLPAARDHGADFLTDMEVTRISPNGDKHPGPWTGGNTLPPFRFEITATHRNTGEIFKFRTRIAVLAAGTVGTASLLLKSKPFLPFISRQLGKNIAINGNVKAAGLLPEGCPDGDMFTGQSHPGIISYEFFNSHGIMISAFKALPLQIFGVARITFNDKKQFWGEDHVRLVKDIRKR